MCKSKNAFHSIYTSYKIQMYIILVVRVVHFTVFHLQWKSQPKQHNIAIQTFNCFHPFYYEQVKCRLVVIIRIANRRFLSYTTTCSDTGCNIGTNSRPFLLVSCRVESQTTHAQYCPYCILILRIKIIAHRFTQLAILSLWLYGVVNENPQYQF